MTAFRIDRPATAFSGDPSDRKQKRIQDDAHLAFVRTLPSVLSGEFGCQACHVRYGDPRYRKKHTGKAQKPDDAWALPLTPSEHRDQHQHNEREWWKANGIDPLWLCLKLYAATGDREAAIKIILAARRPLYAEKETNP